MSEAVLYEDLGGGIALITLNRPDLRNPITEPDMLEAMLATLARIEADPAIKVAILTGAGKGFSSGGNVNAMKPGGYLNRGEPNATRAGYRSGIQRLPEAFARLEVPVIAAVNGAAVGAGMDLACMCDLRIASEQASFAESFVKLGLISGDGGAWLLQRTVGFAKAAEMTLTGEMLSAQDALACGLVSRVVPADELLPTARMLAEKIAANPVHAVRMNKRLLWEARRLDLSGVLEMAAGMQAICHETADHAEAVSAFLEKRAPKFGS